MSEQPGSPAATAAPEKAPTTAVTSIPGPARFASLQLSDDDLITVYERMQRKEPELEQEALDAANEMRNLPLDNLDRRPAGVKKTEQPEGPVGRRAPPNPFHSPKLGKFQMQSTQVGKTKKAEDPALQDNPLRGRLLATIGVNTALMFLFFQTLIYNFLETGSYYVSRSENSMIGPSGTTLFDLGGLNTNAIRAGQHVRLFWAMWMHSGWLHIGFNVLCQLQYMYMLEPDWGFWRTLLLFWFAAITGNLISSVVDPCKTTVGSSGGLFGLMGGIVTFCIEFWSTIPRPWCILIFSIVVAVVSICTGLTSTTDTWCHLGGLTGGTLFGLGTITTLAEVRGSSKRIKPMMKRNKYLVRVQAACCPACRCGWQEWAVRIPCWICILIIWVVCFVYLLKNIEYQPLGSMTFHGMMPCCCCEIPQSETTADLTWMCSQCDMVYPSLSDLTFEDYCASQSPQRRRLAINNATLSAPDESYLFHNDDEAPIKNDQQLLLRGGGYYGSSLLNAKEFKVKSIRWLA